MQHQLHIAAKVLSGSQLPLTFGTSDESSFSFLLLMCLSYAKQIYHPKM